MAATLRRFVRGVVAAVVMGLSLAASAQYATDSFADANTTRLANHTSDSGHTWTVIPTPVCMTIFGSRAVATTTIKPICFLNISMPTADYCVTVEVDRTGQILPTSEMCVAARATATTENDRTAYVVGITETGGVNIYRISGGSATNLGNAQVGSWCTGTLGIQVDGSEIHAIWNGDIVATATDTAITQAGHPGIGSGWRLNRSQKLCAYDNLRVTGVVRVKIEDQDGIVYKGVGSYVSFGATCTDPEEHDLQWMNNWDFLDGLQTGGDEDGNSIWASGTINQAGNFDIAAGCANHGTDTEKLIAVQVDLDAQGVSEDAEFIQGGFVIANDDDDDEDGIVDKYDTSVANENDLLKITLQPVLPGTLSADDVVELSWSDDRIHVYETPSKNSAVNSGATFALNALPKDLYIEGYHLSNYACDVTFDLKYARDDITIASDTINFTVFSLGLYLDASGTRPLYDWPRPVNAIRSPKHVLGKEDNIYIRVTAAPGSLPSLPYGYFTANIKSISDPTGITVGINEIASGIYQNTEQTGELLRLGNETVSGNPADTIKVVEEEVLTFMLTVNGSSYIPDKGVMIDKGEYATCGIEKFFGSATELKNEAEAARVNWWDAGYQQYSNSCGNPADPDHGLMPAFIQNAGNNAISTQECDLLSYNSHGVANGSLYDDDGFSIVAPASVSNVLHWNDDLEWVWAAACDTLNVAGGGRAAWEHALFGAKPCHIIMGYHEPAEAGLNYETDDFFDHAASELPETIVSAFYHCSTDGWLDDPAAILEHRNNDLDKLKEPQPDTQDAALRYYWYTGSWNSTDYTRSSAAANSGDGTGLRLCPIAAQLVPTRGGLSGYKHFARHSGLEAYYTGLNCGELRTQDIPIAEKLASEVFAKLLDGVPDGAKRAPLATLYAIDFEQGEELNLQDSIPIGRTVTYEHTYNNLPVFGDVLSAYVVADRLVKVKASWHQVITPETGKASEIVPAATSHAVARANLLQRLGSNGKNLQTVGHRLGYYGFQDSGKTTKRFFPAWEFRFKTSHGIHREYVDAITNARIPHEEHAKVSRQKIRTDKDMP